MNEPTEGYQNTTKIHCLHVLKIMMSEWYGRFIGQMKAILFLISENIFIGKVFESYLIYRRIKDTLEVSVFIVHIRNHPPGNFIFFSFFLSSKIWNNNIYKTTWHVQSPNCFRFFFVWFMRVVFLVVNYSKLLNENNNKNTHTQIDRTLIRRWTNGHLYCYTNRVSVIC